jgi:hypothetical protein
LRLHGGEIVARRNHATIEDDEVVFGRRKNHVLRLASSEGSEYHSKRDANEE